MTLASMAKPKDPADPPVPAAPTSKPGDPLAQLSMEQMIEVIATVSAQMQGLKGGELKDEVRSLVREVQHVAKDVEMKVAVDDTRKQAVGEIQRLLEILMQASVKTAQVIGPHRDAIAQMFRHVDFEKMSVGLKLINDYLKNPNAVTEVEIKSMMKDLEATMGPIVNYDPSREDEQRREELKQDVQSRLDKIFKNKSYKPDVSNLAPLDDTKSKK